MIKIANWDSRKPGDIILHYSDARLSRWIAILELRLIPNAPQDFIPSHAAIVGYDNKVIEAWYGGGQNSAAALNPVSKYDGELNKGNLELWRVADADDSHVGKALGSFLHDFTNQPYAWPNLLGFAVEAIFHTATNPVDDGNVCSQSDLTYLRYLDLVMFPNSTLGWVDTMDITNTTPLALRCAFLLCVP